MKNFVKVMAVMLVLVIAATSLISCSSYGSIKKDFEKAGYVLQNADNEKTGEIKTDDGVITYTIHTFKKEDANFLETLASGVIVWEFDSDDDLKNAIGESETLKGLIKDAQNSEYVNGNCVLTTFNKDAVEIFNQSK